MLSHHSSLHCPQAQSNLGCMNNNNKPKPFWSFKIIISGVLSQGQKAGKHTSTSTRVSLKLTVEESYYSLPSLISSHWM